MAKSLRSKWRRKMKAVKRERYGAKENDRLIKMLTAAGEYPQPQGDVKTETPDISEVLSPAPPGLDDVSVPRLRRPRKIRGEGRKSRKDKTEDDDEAEIVDEDMESNDEGADGQEEAMAVDKPIHVFSKRTMRDQFGNYPAWMNKRKMRTQQKKNKRIAKRRAVSVGVKKRK